MTAEEQEAQETALVRLEKARLAILDGTAHSFYFVMLTHEQGKNPHTPGTRREIDAFGVICPTDAAAMLPQMISGFCTIGGLPIPKVAVLHTRVEPEPHSHPSASNAKH